MFNELIKNSNIIQNVDIKVPRCKINIMLDMAEGNYIFILSFHLIFLLYPEFASEKAIGTHNSAYVFLEMEIKTKN